VSEELHPKSDVRAQLKAIGRTLLSLRKTILEAFINAYKTVKLSRSSSRK
jgi:hypothetical protein